MTEFFTNAIILCVIKRQNSTLLNKGDLTLKKRNILKGIIVFIGIMCLTIFGTWLLLEDKKADEKLKLIVDSQNKASVSSEPAQTESTIIYNEETDKLDLNTATKEELDTLEGIGPILAERIIEFRNNKPFKTIYDIKKVSGIGEKKFKDIEDKITVIR